MSVFSAYTKNSSTPSSILKKTSSIKSSLSQINTPTKVRFVLPHSQNVQNILKDYVKNNNIKEFENLVCLIRDAELNDDDISSLLKEATECISLLNLDLRLFIEALLRINWTERSESVVAEYQSFIVNLISAHNYHAEYVFNRLVSLFLPNPSEAEWPNGIPGDDINTFMHIHSLFNVLLSIVPMCKEILVNALKVNFPYFKKSAHIHECYLHNLLWIIDYQPTYRAEIINLIFSKLVVMDVNTPKEEIEKVRAQEEDEMFSMDENMSTKTFVPNALMTAHTLDICLDKIFNYLIIECHDVETAELNWAITKDFYQDFLMVFDNVILPTYNTHHVQFVMFLMCSFKLVISDAFLNYLWKKVVNPNIAPVLRQAAINYIVSLLARATFIPITSLKYSLQQMSDWIQSYISNQDGLECVNSDVRIHSVFYAVCQALFYVVAFRHKDLVSTKKNLVFLESLNLTKIVTSRLNPLRVCQSAVVQNFAAITRKYQLAYCYSVIEHNSRNTLPTIYKDEKGAIAMSNNMLSAYYPFDPYILERSSEKIKPHYRQYQESKKDTSHSIETKDMEIDDFLEYQDATTSSSKNRNFSYGSSPGFKWKG